MTPILGHRGPIDEEHDLRSVYILAAELGRGVPLALVDDAGALPTFALEDNARACAVELEHAELPGDPGKPLLESVAVVPCWRSFVTDTLLHAAGLAPGELSDDEAEALSLRTYLFEAATFDAEDVSAQAIDLASRIARAVARRHLRAEGDTTHK